jgi:hypothetical protein
MLLVCTCAGCRSFTSPARATDLKSATAYWVDYDATRRGAILYAEGGKIKMVGEPAPDAALELTQKYLAKVNYQAVSGEASAELAESIVELGKRTQTVMFLRETLYRLAEMANNGQLDATKQVEIYNKIVDAATQLGLAEVAAAEAKQKLAQAKLTSADAEVKTAEAQKQYQLNFKSMLDSGTFVADEQHLRELQKMKPDA